MAIKVAMSPADIERRVALAATKATPERLERFAAKMRARNVELHGVLDNLKKNEPNVPLSQWWGTDAAHQRRGLTNAISKRHEADRAAESAVEWAGRDHTPINREYLHARRDDFHVRDRLQRKSKALDELAQTHLKSIEDNAVQRRVAYEESQRDIGRNGNQGLALGAAGGLTLGLVGGGIMHHALKPKPPEGET